MLHNIMNQHDGKGVLVFGETNIPVRIDRLETSCDALPVFEGHVSGAIYGGTRTNYCGRYKGTTDKFAIQRVLFNDPATIVFWKDGTKTVVKCQDGDVYSEEVGLALCFAKKALGNQSNFNNVFKKWIPEAEEDDKPVVFTLPKLDPCDQMAAQNAIKQLMAHKVPTAAEIMAEFKKHLYAQRGATEEV